MTLQIFWLGITSFTYDRQVGLDSLSIPAEAEANPLYARHLKWFSSEKIDDDDTALQ